jgi:hypothetical protein
MSSPCVEGQGSGSLQPCGGEVAQVYSVGGELPDCVAALVGDEKILSPSRRASEAKRDKEAPNRQVEASLGGMVHLFRSF